MVAVKDYRSSIEIKSKTIIDLQIKMNLLNRLRSDYILKSDEKIVNEIVLDKISEKEKRDLRCFYEQNFYRYSFDEFIELIAFPITTIDLFSKDGTKIAFVDFMPDGDICSIWIDIYCPNYKQILLDLVKEIAR